MIERFYAKEVLSFDSIELDFQPGLVVFTGSSGAGKSVLSEAILALFGHKEIKASHSEIVLDMSLDIEGFEPDDITIIKAVKKEKTRFFLNNQSCSKSQIKQYCSQFFRYINNKERDDFSSTSLLQTLDEIATSLDTKHAKTVALYRDSYQQLESTRQSLAALEEEESRIEQLKELAEFEINKIESIHPEVDEYERLSQVKKRLSKKEKIQEAVQEAEAVFAYESKVSEALALLELDGSYFDEAINTLKIDLQSGLESLNDLEDIDIESLLNRLEQLSSLKRQYGSIEESLAHLEKKKTELTHYENLQFEKTTLLEKIDSLKTNLSQQAEALTLARQQAANAFEQAIQPRCALLFLSSCSIKLEPTPATSSGADRIIVTLGEAEADQISSGEFNRLRLAFLSALLQFVTHRGVLVLDEIDANVSGQESEGIAKLLQELAGHYQIFAISHQPHLPSLAHQHLLVSKQNEQSHVQILDQATQTEEIARMISGSEITDEALQFAKTILARNRP